MKILIVEDESLIAMQLEDMLIDLGCEVVGPASRLRAAEQLLDSGVEIDCAVLDVNISGELVYPVAERLNRAGIPIVFATGYGREGVEPYWREHQILQKPYTIDQIGASISRCVS